MMEREIETTGVNNYCLEEVVTSENDSSSESDSSDSSSLMSQESSNPKVEMVESPNAYDCRHLLWLLWKQWI